MKLILLIIFLIGLIQAEILPFDNSAVDKIFQQKNSALFLFIGDQAAESSAIDAFKAYDSTNPSVILSLSTKQDGLGLFDRLSEYLGVNVAQTPQVLYLSSSNDKYQFKGEVVTAQQLANFVQRVERGQVQKYLKSAPIPEANDEAVKVVVGKTFEEYVLKSDKQVLVKFYAPWCGHCKTLAPHYEEAAKRLAKNPNILLVKVDSIDNEVSGVDIQGFPTLKFWKKDKLATPLNFNGERTADGIVAWIKEHTEYEWVDLDSDEASDNEQQL